jgi:hypothetical protein
MGFSTILIICMLLAFVGYTLDVLNRVIVDIKFIKLKVQKLD